MKKLECYGGPCDGRKVKPGTLGYFIWGPSFSRDGEEFYQLHGYHFDEIGNRLVYMGVKHYDFEQLEQ